MIEATFTALFDLVNEAVLMLIIEGFFLGEAPRGTTGNYAVFSPITIVPEYDMSSHLELIPVQITIVTNEDLDNEGPSEAIQVGEAMMALCDDATMTITGAHLIRFDKQSHNLIQDPDGGWMYQIDYVLLVQEA
jgi:hypothetical protein